MTLPLTTTVSPDSQLAVREVIAQARAAGTPLYPIGGGTSQEFGLPVRAAGMGVSLRKLSRVVDYPARDMTITVEAGMTMAALAATLAGERQRLPIDAPQAGEATIGGVIATNFSGPRRYGHGTIRDYVLGISAIDGHATAFKAGGRVVKNVAGYDLCKVLTGSLGTLAIITQATLKVRPVPESSALVACDVADFDEAERLLAALVSSKTTPTAVELLAGPAWNDDPQLGAMPANRAARLVVGFEGTEGEVRWLGEQLQAEWRELSMAASQIVAGERAAALWQRLIDFSITDGAAAVLKLSVVPSRVGALMALLRSLDPRGSLQAHAGNGAIVARLGEFAAGQTARQIVQRIHPAVAAAQGSVVVWACTSPDELTRLIAWGPPRAEYALMQRVKQQFDPLGLLNPGRFLFAS